VLICGNIILVDSFKPKTQLCNFGAKILYEKRSRKKLRKLTHGGLGSKIGQKSVTYYLNSPIMII
jgi:hypothetical protein